MGSFPFHAIPWTPLDPLPSVPPSVPPSPPTFTHDVARYRGLGILPAHGTGAQADCRKENAWKSFR